MWIRKPTWLAHCTGPVGVLLSKVFPNITQNKHSYKTNQIYLKEPKFCNWQTGHACIYGTGSCLQVCMTSISTHPLKWMGLWSLTVLMTVQADSVSI